MYPKHSSIENHLKDYATFYLFMMMLFLTGVIFGAILVNSMSFIQKQDLFFYLEQFFEQVIHGKQLEKRSLFFHSLGYHFRYLLLFFTLGLSIIGLPFVWILLFLKGLMIGFSVGFIVNQLGVQGLLLSSLAIAPQNLIIIPIYIIAGSLSMIFSFTLIGKLLTRSITRTILEPFGRYIFLFSCLLIFSALAAFVEAFVANGAMQSFIEMIYD